MEEKGSYLPPLQHPQYPNYNASEKNPNADNPPPYSSFNLNVPPVVAQQQRTVHLVITPTTQQYPSYCTKGDHGAPQNFPATRITTTTATSEDGWYESNQKNKPQSNSAGAASLIFISGGMNLAMSFTLLYDDMMNSWFYGVIIGAVLGMILAHKVQKKPIILFSAFMVALGGILFTALPYDSDAIMAARYINGIANGLAFAPTLILAGEEAVKTFRGMMATSLEAFCFSSGIFIQLFFTDFISYQVHGGISITYGVFAFVLCYFLYIESPVYLLTHNQEEKAIDALRRLQRPGKITTETYQQLAEHKRYIAENANMTLAEAAVAGLPALLKLCFYRGLAAMSFNAIICFAMYESYSGYFFAWPFYIFGTMRFVGSFIALFLMDSVGRTKPMLVGINICSILAIGVGVTMYIGKARIVAMYLLFAFQLFAGLFISSSSVYLTEAFPLAVKSYYIAIAFIVEMLVQIIINFNRYSTDMGTYLIYFVIFAVMGLLFFSFGKKHIPETKKDTLREAQVKFRSCK